MSELDDKRINNFFENIKDTQVVITCTEKIELKNKEGNIFCVRNGEIFDI